MLEVIYINSRMVATVTHKDIDPLTGVETGTTSIHFEPAATEEERTAARRGPAANYPEI